jgi:hypothetical protein
MSYNYLLLPDTDRLTLATMQKIEELAGAGARVIAQKKIKGTPGFSGYPDADHEVKMLADVLWDQKKIITETNWDETLSQEGLQPDFQGEGLNYIHRRTEQADIYFVANPAPEVVEAPCTFRVEGKVPELWDPETGETRVLPAYSNSNGLCKVPLVFGPMQSWFLVFRESEPSERPQGKNFPGYVPVKNIDGPWKVSFDPEWGGPDHPLAFDTLVDWADFNDKSVCYYSGTATYENNFHLSPEHISPSSPVLLDLGRVEIMARVRVNGTACGITWKPPYRVDIREAVRPGENKLEIDVVNTWINRMIGDEFMPEDSDWFNWETLKEWPEWFLNDEPRPSGRFTFTSARHYTSTDTLVASGLLGPVRIYKVSD